MVSTTKFKPFHHNTIIQPHTTTLPPQPHTITTIQPSPHHTTSYHLSPLPSHPPQILDEMVAEMDAARARGLDAIREADDAYHRAMTDLKTLQRSLDRIFFILINASIG